MTIRFSQRYTVVSVPCICDCLPCVAWNSSGKVEGWLGIVCFLVTTMRWHHSTGSPIGTLSTTPRASSRRRSLCTWSCQCTGIGIALCRATGTALSFRWISTGGPLIDGSCWWGQVLNVELAYCSSSQSFIFGMFSGVHAKGRDFGREGTDVRLGQLQVLPSSFWTPHISIGVSFTWRVKSPTDGKSWLMTPRSTILSYDRYSLLTSRLTPATSTIQSLLCCFSLAVWRGTHPLS